MYINSRHILFIVYTHTDSLKILFYEIILAYTTQLYQQAPPSPPVTLNHPPPLPSLSPAYPTPLPSLTPNLPYSTHPKNQPLLLFPPLPPYQPLPPLSKGYRHLPNRKPCYLHQNILLSRPRQRTHNIKNSNTILPFLIFFVKLANIYITSSDMVAILLVFFVKYIV